MRRLSLLLLAAVFVGPGCTGSGNVADGQLARINWTDSTIRLDTGESFDVPERYEMNRLQTGDRVTVVYEVRDGRNVATRVWHHREFD